MNLPSSAQLSKVYLHLRQLDRYKEGQLGTTGEEADVDSPSPMVTLSSQQSSTLNTPKGGRPISPMTPLASVLSSSPIRVVATAKQMSKELKAKVARATRREIMNVRPS
eukprot:7244018-Pyramimonas_sp.AAC.1